MGVKTLLEYKRNQPFHFKDTEACYCRTEKIKRSDIKVIHEVIKKEAKNIYFFDSYRTEKELLENLKNVSEEFRKDHPDMTNYYSKLIDFTKDFDFNNSYFSSTDRRWNSKIYEEKDGNMIFDFQLFPGLDIKVISKKEDVKTEKISYNHETIVLNKKDSKCKSEIKTIKKFYDEYIIEKCIIEFHYEKHYCSHCNEEFYELHNTNIMTSFITGTYIYDNEKSIKLSILKNNYSYINKKKTMHHALTKSSYIYDKNTFKLYYIRNKNMSQSETMKNMLKYGFSNITLSHDSSSVTDKKFVVEVFNYLKLNYKDEFEYLFTDLMNLHLKFRCKYKSYFKMIDEEKEFFKDYLNKYSEEEYDKDTIKESFRKTIHLIIPLFFIKKNYNIKNTSLALAVYFYRHYNNYTFDDIRGKSEKEILKSLKLSKSALKLFVEKYIKDNNSVSCLAIYYHLLNNHDDSLKILKDKKCDERPHEKITVSKKSHFMYYYKKNNKDKSIADNIIKYQYYISDTQRMYNQIMEKNPNYIIDYSRNIKEIHDTLSIDLSKIKNQNKKIPENKFINEVFKDYEFDGITYELPKDTHTLIKVGTAMRICVGSYGNRAVKKECFIVVGYKEGTPVTCIELRYDKKNSIYTVEQVKKYRNQCPEEKEADDFVRLFNNNNIYLRTSDLINAKEEVKFDYNRCMEKIS